MQKESKVAFKGSVYMQHMIWVVCENADFLILDFFFLDIMFHLDSIYIFFLTFHASTESNTYLIPRS